MGQRTSRGFTALAGPIVDHQGSSHQGRVPVEYHYYDEIQFKYYHVQYAHWLYEPHIIQLSIGIHNKPHRKITGSGNNQPLDRSLHSNHAPTRPNTATHRYRYNPPNNPRRPHHRRRTQRPRRRRPPPRTHPLRPLHRRRTPPLPLAPQTRRRLQHQRPPHRPRQTSLPRPTSP